MIEALFGEAAAKTGLSESQVIAALAGSLGLIRRHADPAKSQALFDAVPGTAELAEAGAEAAPKGGGLLGGFMKAAGGAGGAAMSDAMALQGRLQKQGVSLDALKRLLPVAREFVRRQTGRDLLGDTLQSIPGVGGMLGGD
jgi:hypothetical protein